ncbi:MAG: hypothetical protein NZ577_01170 [Vicinamibacterales bacterium]|nr:hypothetical protein [Vicinamibacterales bacterium]
MPSTVAGNLRDGIDKMTLTSAQPSAVLKPEFPGSIEIEDCR